MKEVEGLSEGIETDYQPPIRQEAGLTITVNKDDLKLPDNFDQLNPKQQKLALEKLQRNRELSETILDDLVIT